MIGQNGTYFTPLNCVDPYFILSGYTDDMMCSDRLTQSDLRMELHHHLRQNGFDAVIFFDVVSMITVLDMQSSFVVQHLRVPTASELQDIENAMRAGHDRTQPVVAQSTFRRRRSTAGRPLQTRFALNMDVVNDTTVWERIRALLNHDELRCAFVFSSLHNLQTSFNAHALDVLPLISRNRSTNRSIAVFIAHTAAHADLENLMGHGTGHWVNFAGGTLLPRINPPENSAPELNRLIRLGTPNAAEIRSFLTIRRLSRNNPITVDLANMEEICIRISALAASLNRSLASISMALEQWRVANPQAILTLENCTSMLGGKNYRTVRQRLDSLVGLDSFREFIHSWEVLQDSSGDSAEAMPATGSRLTPLKTTAAVQGHSLNVALVGEPGTGKSTVAELIGQLYREMGLLPLGNVVTVTSAQLVSAAVGQTATNVHSWVQRAMGGVLFIDEAYSLMNNAHGQDAIDALVNDMGQYAGRFAVILAGYKAPINELLSSNDGLFRRFPNIIELESYTPEQMLEIFRRMAAREENVVISEELDRALPDFFNGWVRSRSTNWGNAGEAENLLVRLRRNCAVRQQQSGVEGATLTLTADDIPPELQRWLRPRAQSLTEAIRKIQDIKGLDNVKNYLLELAQTIALSDTRPEAGAYIFYGPPGTGKTMMAERMAELLNQLGVLSRYDTVVYTASELVEPPRGKRRPGENANPAENSLQEAIERARGGLLFIDEAHQLADENNPRGREILRQLVPFMEDAEFRSSTCIILAGYASEMERVFQVDAGLASRFPTRNRIRFNNYTAQELVDIMQGMAADQGETLEEGFINRTLTALTHELADPKPNFGNARFIRNVYLPKAQARRNQRILRDELGLGLNDPVTPEHLARLAPAARHTLTGHDIPEPYNSYAGPHGAAPVTPRTAESLLNELLEKDDIVNFIRERTRPEGNIAFYGEEGGGNLNFSIAGPIGCGRHTAITAAANAFCDAGLITSREVHYLSKGDLEGRFVGQTAGDAASAISAHQGGVIVISNPSSMLPDDGGRTFGPEAVNAVLASMDAYAENTCFVFMDSEEGIEAFFKAYPHARRLVSKHFLLRDLSIDSMQRIFNMKTVHRFAFAEDIRELLDDFIANWVNDRGGLGDNFAAWSNGAAIDQLLSDLVTNWTTHDGQTATDDDHYPVRLVTRDMFPTKLQSYFKSTRSVAATAMSELMDLTGLTRVKQSIRVIEAKLRRMPRDRVMPGLYCFLGNPGTGKTKVANLMGGVLRSLNVLSQGYVIERKALDMVASPDHLDATIRLARNNVLFIDEAYEILNTGARGEAFIAQLLKVLEDVDVLKNTCIILAGYPREMYHLLQMNSGLNSRFGTQDSILHFDDYNADELMSILSDMASRPQKYPQIGAYAPLQISDPRCAEFLEAARSIMHGVTRTNDPTFGNARFVRNLLHDAVSNQVLRLDKQYGADQAIPEEEYSFLSRQDIPQRLERYTSTLARPRAEVRADRLTTGVIRPIPDTMLHTEIQRLSPSIMFLEVEHNNGDKGSGTGFVITADGLLLTCAHVVDNARTVRARLLIPGMPGGDTRWFNCTVLDPVRNDLDMAMLAIEGGGNFTPLPLRTPDQPLQLTESTMIIGYPFGTVLDKNADRLQPTHFEGRICNVQHQGTPNEFHGVDSSGKCGNSGSPVISREDGQVIGVFCGSKTHGQDLKEEINYFKQISWFWSAFVPENN